MLQTAELVNRTPAHRDNRRLLKAFVEDEEDHKPTMSGDKLILAVRWLQVQVWHTEMPLLVSVGKECVPVIETLVSINGPVDSDASSPSQAHGGS